MIFNIDKETMPREKIREIQLSRLQDLCRRVYANVPFYRRSFDEKGIKPSDVQSLDDLKFLPFTLKQDMRNNYPYGLFAVPMEMIQRIHASSGTTGKATVVGYTKRDIETWAECAARSLAAAGATANDIVQVSYGYGLFTGRPRRTLRRGTPRRDRHPHVRRLDQASGPAHARLRRDRALLYAVLRPASP